MAAAARERVLFLYLPTGGGHASNCRAISGRLRDSHGAEVLVLDPIGLKHARASRMAESFYRIMSQRLPTGWSFLYRVNQTESGLLLSQEWTRRFSQRGIEAAIERFKPTRIVCTHHLLARALTGALKKHPGIPAVMIATDPFDPPLLWIRGHRLPVFCYSEQARRFFIARGYPEAKLSVFDPIIEDRFFSPMGAAEIAAFKREEGFDAGRPLVLISGGGDGLRMMTRIMIVLSRSARAFDLALVCGKDETTRARAAALAPALAAGRRTIKVYGFTRKMKELISASALVVSKAGPALMCEIAACGKPNIVASFIPGQEKPNVEWLQRNGAGLYRPGLLELRAAVERMLDDEGYRRRFEERIRCLDLSNGLGEISEAIMRLGGGARG